MSKDECLKNDEGLMTKRELVRLIKLLYLR